jgi:hypothetical protein
LFIEKEDAEDDQQDGLGGSGEGVEYSTAASVQKVNGSNDQEQGYPNQGKEFKWLIFQGKVDK